MLICTEDSAKIFDLFRIIYNSIRIGAPIILLVAGMINFARAIVNPDKFDTQKALEVFKKMTFAAVCVFLVPTVVATTLRILGSESIDNILDCSVKIFEDSNPGGTGGQKPETPVTPGGSEEKETEDGGGSDTNINDPSLNGGNTSGGESGDGTSGGEEYGGGTEYGNGEEDESGGGGVGIEPEDGQATSEFGDAIAKYALQLYNNNRSEWSYATPSETTKRRDTYNGKKTNGKYMTDCNGFVGFVVNRATGLGKAPGSATTSVLSFTCVYPGGSSWSPRGWANSCIKVISTGLSLSSALSKAQPGDLLGSNGDGSSHTQIYVGNGEIVDLASKNGITKRGKSSIRHSNGRFTILRVMSNDCH